MLWSTILGN